MKSYEDLKVWQKSMVLCHELYKLTAGLPESERFNLTIQLRRAAVSILSNIAEGQRRGSRKDFSHFLRMAFGSCAEIETQVRIAALIYPELDVQIVQDLTNEVSRMLRAVIYRLNQPLQSTT